MDNIEDILRALTEDNDSDSADSSETSEIGSDGGGLFSGLDPEMLIKLLSVFEALNQPSDSERFLLALKPLLREENRPKIDSALRMMKLFSVLPLLRDGGFLNKLL